MHVLVISLNKDFADDWQSVLDSLGARVTKRISPSAQLALIRDPDVVVTDSRAPKPLCQVCAVDIFQMIK
jgi:CheY-like chemotaxis protein